MRRLTSLLHHLSPLHRAAHGRSQRTLIAGLIAVAIIAGVTTFATDGLITKQYSGKLVQVTFEDIKSKQSRQGYALETNDKLLRLDLQGRQTPAAPGAPVQVTAKPKDHDTLKVSAITKPEDVPEAKEVSDAPKAPDALQKVAVVMFNFKNDRSQPYNSQELRELTFTNPDSPNALYREQSFNKVGFTGARRSDGDVFGWYTINKTNQDCQTNSYEWTNAAESAARAQGVDLRGYEHVVFAFPKSDCNASAFGEQDGRRTWLNGSLQEYGPYRPYVISHELGHNFGLAHANRYHCEDAKGATVAISDNCQSIEYGDIFDVMGSGLRAHTNNLYKASNAWFEKPNVRSVTASGSYTLGPVERANGGVQLLRVPAVRGPNGTPQSYYYLEYRQPVGFDDGLGPEAYNGVIVRYGPGFGAGYGTNLIDTTPETPMHNDAPLAVGKTFADPARGVTVKVTAATAAGINVRIDLAQPAPESPETAPVYRLWNGRSGDHFYTMNPAERDGAIRGGYAAEGVAGYLPAAGTPNAKTVYRLYNSSVGDHFYTTSADEAEAARRSGYLREGSLGSIFPEYNGDTAPLMRMWSSKATDHFYTANYNELLAAYNGGYGFEELLGWIGTTPYR